MSHPRRRTAALRTAAVAALAGGALLVPATGAFAAAPAPSASHTTAPRTGEAGKPEKYRTEKTAKSEKAGTPRGGVRAGTDGLRDTGNPAFLAAGGAMAAAGAAGLGFAMLRRGRTDG
ncbi:hypothetical protein C9F11_27445 [Streptomyces sp. YIM 121038]|uniref:hypothetical protein n=1 Tax=Streptomyces sp. YIM 121038 TaxID=2136401 RepID=UPI0011109799|nr:hypothetical protein [Streptomyces sp. YIM 121038]QCX79092.1 hypothetical protein C9F11_27445 [Streptomyces sp. YIM 121038]